MPRAWILTISMTIFAVITALLASTQVHGAAGLYNRLDYEKRVQNRKEACETIAGNPECAAERKVAAQTLLSTLKAVCETERKKNGCDELYKEITEADGEEAAAIKIKGCTDHEVCGRGTDWVAMGESCWSGAKRFGQEATDAAIKTIQAMGNSAVETAKCDRNEDGRKLKLYQAYNDTVPDLMRADPPKGHFLEEASCGEIARHINGVYMGFQKRLSSNLIAFEQANPKARAAAVKSDCSAYSDDLLQFRLWLDEGAKTDQEAIRESMKAFKQAFAAVPEMLKKMNVKMECYTPATQTEIACHAATAAVASLVGGAAGAAGGKALMLLARSSGSLKVAKAVHEIEKLNKIEDRVTRGLAGRAEADAQKDRVLAAVDKMKGEKGDRERQQLTKALGVLKDKSPEHQERILNAVVEAHNMCADKGYGTYDPRCLRMKALHLKNQGWLSAEERELLMRNGIAGKYADIPDDARKAQITAFDKKSPHSVTNWTDHWQEAARTEMLRDKPDPAKFQSALKKNLEGRLNSWWRADRTNLPEPIAQGMKSDSALLGSVSRGNAELFAKSKEMYQDVIRFQLRKVEKSGGNSKEYVQRLLAEKKAMKNTGPLGEMDRFEVEALTDLAAILEKNPKFVQGALDPDAFQQSKLFALIDKAKADLDKAVIEGPVAPSASDVAGTVVQATKPPVGSTFKPIQFEKPEDFARRQKLAQDYKAWSGGTEITDEQSQYLAWGHAKYTDSGAYGGIERLQKMGFDTREARLLQMNGFEVGPNRKFAVPKIPDEVVARSQSNFVREPVWNAPANLPKTEAAKLIAAIRRPIDDVIKELKDQAEKLNFRAMSAKDRAELDQTIAGRNAHAEYCRKLISVWIAANPESSSQARTWKELTTTGPCRY